MRGGLDAGRGDVVVNLPTQPSDSLVWTWRPSRTGWFAALLPKLERWRPTGRLTVTAAFTDALVQSCKGGEAWLVHPSVNAVMSGSETRRRDRDLALITWTARHVDIDGAIDLAEPHILWTNEGGAHVAPGHYALANLPGRDGRRRRTALDAINIDPWCASAGVPIASSWAEREPSSEAEIADLAATIRRYCTMIETFQRLVPGCFAWVSSITCVAVPLRPRRGELHSHSHEELPGLVALDVPDDLMAFIELLVRESAHHHLFMADAGAPLIQPDHVGPYRSPLHTDPRPLRDVLLAYHALAYVCAAYRDVGSRVRFGERSLTDHERLRSNLRDAATVIADAVAFLTPEGREFLELTDEVAAYGGDR
jgi:HEXXH motif-containing protein